MSFAAYILSYADDDPAKRAARFKVHNEQLDEWIMRSRIPLHVLAMNYQPGDYRMNPRIIYHDLSPRRTSEARHAAFDLFYGGKAEWGIIMDNDATLYGQAQHNSSYGLIDQMSRQLSEYRDIGLFSPVNPQKTPFTALLASPVHQANHVFTRNMDLKGSMVLVRNFRAAREAEVWPDTTYDWCEDGKLAMDAVALGHSVMRCENIVLRERGLGSSSFGAGAIDRKPFMQAANMRMVQEFGSPLRMSQRYPHLLDRRAWLKATWKGATRKVVAKP